MAVDSVWLGPLAWGGRHTPKTWWLFALAAILIAIDLSDHAIGLATMISARVT